MLNSHGIIKQTVRPVPGQRNISTFHERSLPLKQEISDGKIACAAAHEIAVKLNISPIEVGVNMDLLEMRLSKCQLGLFGYEKQKKIVKPADNIDHELEKLLEQLISDGRISCKACWDAADKIRCSRLDVSDACEALKVKISQCQFGAF